MTRRFSCALNDNLDKRLTEFGIYTINESVNVEKRQMSVKEKITLEINNLALGELVLLYEQIRLMKKMKTKAAKQKPPLSLTELHHFTSSSKTSWADAISEGREDRV